MKTTGFVFKNVTMLRGGYSICDHAGLSSLHSF